MIVQYQPTNVPDVIAVVIFGMLINTIFFNLLAIICSISHRTCNCFPAIVCKIISWYGIVTIFDFLLIFIVDILVQVSSASAPR